MKLFISMILLSTAYVSVSGYTGQCMKPATKINTGSNPYDQFTSLSSQHCRMRCIQSETCTIWSWVRRESRCYLKKGKSGTSVYDYHVESGFSYCKDCIS